MAPRPTSFDPLGILATLERNRVAYVLIGGLAQVLRGADIVTNGVDVCPSFAKDNLDLVHRAVADLLPPAAADEAGAVVDDLLAERSVRELQTNRGQVKIVASPAGVPNGYVELRRAASREDLGHGVRPMVASTADLATMAAASGRQVDLERAAMLRRILEFEARPGERQPAVAPTRPGARVARRAGPRLSR